VQSNDKKSQGWRSSTIKALLAHPGTQYSSQLARQLQWHNCLHRFWTSFALAENSFIERFIRRVMATPPDWLGHRTVPGVPQDKIRTVLYLEVAALARLRLGGESQIVMHDRNEKFQRAIAQADIEKSNVVIGFDTSSNILADRAAKAGRPLILDQTIAHPRSKQRVYESIKEQFPDWADDLEVRANTVSVAEDAEHRKATKVVVASSFTKKTLIENGVLEDKIILNPYGVDLTRFSSNQEKRRVRPFRFLFAGLVCARKGIPLLLKAWKSLPSKDAELWIVGPLTQTAAAKCQSGDQVKIIGKVPNTELARIMAESDVFVFPSYFEGFGLVLLEAMAAGLPVLTTTATAGPDTITEGSDGFIFSPGDLDVLICKMEFCLKNRDQIAQMGVNARATAERFSWDAYGDRWKAILKEVA
jgi:glycosyltransferase involved in cell wall biosynthesis